MTGEGLCGDIRSECQLCEVDPLLILEVRQLGIK